MTVGIMAFRAAGEAKGRVSRKSAVLTRDWLPPALPDHARRCHNSGRRPNDVRREAFRKCDGRKPVDVRIERETQDLVEVDIAVVFGILQVVLGDVRPDPIGDVTITERIVANQHGQRG